MRGGRCQAFGPCHRRGIGRRRIDQPPAEPGDAEEKNCDPDRFVELEQSNGAMPFRPLMRHPNQILRMINAVVIQCRTTATLEKRDVLLAITISDLAILVQTMSARICISIGLLESDADMQLRLCRAISRQAFHPWDMNNGMICAAMRATATSRLSLIPSRALEESPDMVLET